MFVTAFIGRLHVPTGQLSYCNAGHMPPLVVVPSGDDGQHVKNVSIKPNVPLGYEGEYQFVEQSMTLAPDETLVLYTDGITEALNKNQEMLEMDGWRKIVESVHALSDTSLPVESLLAEVKAFMGDAEQADDITLLVISKTNATTDNH